MKPWIAILLLAAGLGACEEPKQPAPPAPGPGDPVAETVRPETEAPFTESFSFPGGTVQRLGEVMISVGTGMAKSKKGSDRLMAERAAYLIAVRNAGLYLAGVRVNSQGQLTATTGGAIPRHLRVTDFRQTHAALDPKTLTATVTVEIRLGK